MNNKCEFLNYIYKNAEMGIVGINCVINKVKDNKLKKLILKHKNEYNEITCEAKALIKKYNGEKEGISIVAKLGSAIITNINLLKDESDKNIVKMLIEGTNKGLIEIIDKLNTYNIDEPAIEVLGTKLKKTLEKNIESLKKYL